MRGAVRGASPGRAGLASRVAQPAGGLSGHVGNDADLGKYRPWALSLAVGKCRPWALSLAVGKYGPEYRPCS